MDCVTGKALVIPLQNDVSACVTISSKVEFFVCRNGWSLRDYKEQLKN